MVYWQKFDPEQFDFEFDEDELAKHGITVDEVVEVIWNGFGVRRNKRYHGVIRSSDTRTVAAG